MCIRLQKFLKEVLSTYSELLILTTITGLFWCFTNSEYYFAWILRMLKTCYGLFVRSSTHSNGWAFKFKMKERFCSCFNFHEKSFDKCTCLLCFCESVVSTEQSRSDKCHFGATFTFLTLIPQNELNNQPHPRTAPLA